MLPAVCITICICLLSILSYAQTSLFDANWKFHRGGAQRAEMPGYNDSQWRTVHLPHDWSIEDLPGKSSPFDSLAIGQVSTGFTVGGTGWYRKSFTIPANHQGKMINIQFDGIYMNADIWINGIHLGNHPYGYTSFILDLTRHIKFDTINTIAVQVKNEGQNSRWYTGSGIYRHVWLKITEPVHLVNWGTSISASVTKNNIAAVTIKTKVNNESKGNALVKLITKIIDASGKQVMNSTASTNIPADSVGEFSNNMWVPSPRLWSVDTPSLYKAISELYLDDKLIEQDTNTFGIRSIVFTADRGFLLNGIPLKLKGGCVHHDNGPLGAKAFDRAEERRVEILKASGYNAIRCAHNPPSPAFLDACDRLGMMVIDEAFDMWRLPNNPHDYHLFFDDHWKRDIESMVYRDRNHPSIIMWSIGNEIKDMENPKVIEVAKMLRDHIKSIDTTRPVTAAVNNLRPQKDPYFSVLDVAGYNYAAGGDHLKKSIYAEDHERVPGRIMYGSESYALEAFDAWMGVVDHPWVIGDFVWTAFDYIGEASIGWRGYWQESNFYPWNLAYCGDIDICGWKRPQSFYRDALWKENQLSLFVTPPSPSFPLNPNKQSWSKWEWHDVVADWNWPSMANKPLEVSVYSSCETVELFLNNKSLGKKKTDRSTEYIAKWNVPYQAGELKAIGYKGTRKVNTALLNTAGDVASIKLTSDSKTIKADGQSLVYVTVELIDAKGNRHPKAEELVKFQVEGPATIVAVANANPVSIESYQVPQRKTWNGRCLVILRSNGTKGNVQLKASVDDLPGAALNLIAE